MPLVIVEDEEGYRNSMQARREEILGNSQASITQSRNLLLL